VSEDEGDSWTYRPIDVANVRGKKTYGTILGFQEPPNAGKPLKPQQPFHAYYGSTAMSALWSQQLALDEHESFYLGWIDALDDLPYVSVSRDRGVTWSEPVCVSPPEIEMASIGAIAVGRPGEVAVAYYASRDGGESFDACVSVTRDVFAGIPSVRTAYVSPSKPLQPNRLSEPIELVGVAFAPDGRVWASFARDNHVLDLKSEARQCDGNFKYNGTRFTSVVVRIEPS